MTSDRPESSRKTRRGMWTVLAMFLVGAAVLWGLFLVPHETAAPIPAPPSPRGVPEPGHTLRFLNYDVAEDLASTETVAAKFRALGEEGRIHFVMLQRVRPDQVLPLVAGLKMESTYRPQLFQRVGPAGERAPSGCLLLSAFELYDVTPMRSPGNGNVIGLRAEAVVDGWRFTVACVDTGGGPMLVALPPPYVFGGRPRDDLSFSPEWFVPEARTQSVGKSGRSIDVARAHAATVRTQSTTRPR